MLNTAKTVNVELHSRDDEGNVCDTDNLNISEQDTSLIIDKAAELILIFKNHQTKSAQAFYDAAFDSLDDLEQELIKAGVLSSD